jgi:hypothetical protein
MENYNSLLSTLGEKEKETLKALLEKKIKALHEVWTKEIRIDAKHLELVNICYNLFTKSTDVNHKTGYSILLVDPLCTLDIKIFDLLLYNEENQTAILIDAKSSISDRGISGTVDDICKTALAASDNKNKLEELIGKPISKMEYVILIPAYYAKNVRDAVLSKQASICVWAYFHDPSKLQLIQQTKEDVSDQRLSGRTHTDENMRQILVKSIPARMGALRSLPIMPTSHIFTKFEYLSQNLFVELDRLPKEKRWFGYSSVFSLLKRAYSATELDDVDIERETKKLINSALNANLFKKINRNEEIERSEFIVNYKRSSYERFRQEYFDNRPSETAYKEATEEFKRTKGIKKLTDF